MHYFILFLTIIGIGIISMNLITVGLLILFFTLALYMSDEAVKHFNEGEAE